MEIGQEIRLSRAVGNEDASKQENRTLSDPFDDDEKEEEVKPVVKSEPVQQPKQQQVHQPRPQQQPQNPRPQQQQNPKPQQQQPRPRNNVEDPNGLYNFFRGGCVIGARTNDNRVALDPSGSIFTFTSRDLSAYFERYFKYYGYENIYFGDGSAQLNDIPQMYLIFPKMEKIAVAGRSASDIEVELLGGKSRGAHVKLDGRFKELVRPFVDMSKLVVNESQKRDKNGRAFCYIELDADAVLSALFLHNKAYRVILLDTVQQGSNVLYRVARLREVNSGGSDIREIIEHITK